MHHLAALAWLAALPWGPAHEEALRSGRTIDFGSARRLRALTSSMTNANVEGGLYVPESLEMFDVEVYDRRYPLLLAVDVLRCLQNPPVVMLFDRNTASAKWPAHLLVGGLHSALLTGHDSPTVSSTEGYGAQAARSCLAKNFCVVPNALRRADGYAGGDYWHWYPDTDKCKASKTWKGLMTWKDVRLGLRPIHVLLLRTVMSRVRAGIAGCLPHDQLEPSLGVLSSAPR